MTVRSVPTLCHSSFVVATKAMVLTFLFTLAFGAAADAGSDPRLVDDAADIVLLGGKVITVAQDNSIAQAAGLKHDRIVAVGDDAAIRKLIGPKTHVIQLHGKAVLPGLIDAHTHIEGISDYHRMLDLHIPPLKDEDEMLRKIKERAENRPRENGS